MLFPRNNYWMKQVSSIKFIRLKYVDTEDVWGAVAKMVYYLHCFFYVHCRVYLKHPLPRNKWYALIIFHFPGTYMYMQHQPMDHGDDIIWRRFLHCWRSERESFDHKRIPLTKRQ